MSSSATTTTHTAAVTPSAETIQLRRISAPPCPPSQRNPLQGDQDKSRRSSWPRVSERPLRSALKQTSQSEPLAPLPFELPTILPTSPRDRVGDVKILKFRYPATQEYLAAHPELGQRAIPARVQGGRIRPLIIPPSTWHGGASGSPVPNMLAPQRNIILVRTRAFRIVAPPKKGEDVIPPAPLARDLRGPPEAPCGHLRFELPPRKSFVARMMKKWKSVRNELRSAVY
ncbi:hypothetical protein FB45DRAFT_876067 [Roridomyces roridus]|uniref:Uncharacterized protein n=1 Tax=Roridomyces roridus TaxID=1738132 RepID=A0AAD7B3W0_9AGAR|nr:hypothetical protein FB45DRAFT_876067 [Roridomyces roridus]